MPDLAQMKEWGEYRSPQTWKYRSFYIFCATCATIYTDQDEIFKVAYNMGPYFHAKFGLDQLWGGCVSPPNSQWF